MTAHENRTAVLALGGNAISPRGEQDTIANQFRHTRRSMVAVHHLIDRGFNLAITHGNGPQVGNALLRVELSADQAPILPLGICVADIEGGMGYMIQQSIQNLLRENGIEQDVVTLITQVVVGRNDPEITDPSKFIGQRYDSETAHRLAERFGWTIRETLSGKWRRAVPSPKPISIVKSESIRELVCGGKIVVAAGGGGIPVYIMENGDLEGFDAVVDKDLASGILAHEIDASHFFILTDVDAVALNYGKPNEKPLAEMTVGSARNFLDEGHFPPGSMGPKIEAAIDYLERGGDHVLIASIENIADALDGKSGTVIAN